MTATKKYAAKHGSRESMTNTVDAIRTLTPFKTSGALSGNGWNNYGTFGRLNEVYREAYQRDQKIGVIDYVVFSYSTPILWHVTATSGPNKGKGKWHFVDQRFSSTTASHQSMCQRATFKDSYFGTEPAIEFGVWA